MASDSLKTVLGGSLRRNIITKREPDELTQILTTACLRHHYNLLGRFRTLSDHERDFEHTARGEPRCFGERICTSGESYYGG